MEYLFRDWHNIKKDLLKRDILLLLDYDGTLAPIAEAPHKATIPRQTKNLLVRLSKTKRCKLAIISGRALKDIKKIVGLRGIIYSGNHGLEIEGPKIKFIPRLPSGYRLLLAQIKKDLINRVSKIKGILIEDKALCLSLHYRRVDANYIAKVKTVFQEVTILPRIKNKISIRPGKKVFEIRPPIEWDKGKVALWLSARCKFANQERPVMPIYIGDDLTDEDAFRALNNKGLTIFVGRPRLSYANYYLKNTEEVYKVLNYILKICHN